mmetsp:Transcript_2824/g.10233  ORF Transcript_2824/g.10233 Transcript_2824/m.10233 type:complete len:312 (-) Transcript_2824:2419-3354(-)
MLRKDDGERLRGHRLVRNHVKHPAHEHLLRQRGVTRGDRAHPARPERLQIDSPFLEGDVEHRAVHVERRGERQGRAAAGREFHVRPAHKQRLRLTEGIHLEDMGLLLRVTVGIDRENVHRVRLAQSETLDAHRHRRRRLCVVDAVERESTRWREQLGKNGGFRFRVVGGEHEVRERACLCECHEQVEARCGQALHARGTADKLGRAGVRCERRGRRGWGRERRQGRGRARGRRRCLDRAICHRRVGLKIRPGSLGFVLRHRKHLVHRPINEPPHLLSDGRGVFRTLEGAVGKHVLTSVLRELLDLDSRRVE